MSRKWTPNHSWTPRSRRSVVFIPDDDGHALQLAASRGDAGAVDRLLSRSGEGRRLGKLLQTASQKGHAEVVEVLLNRGANPHEASGFSSDTTPLHSAAKGGHVGVISILLGRGAFVDARNKFGRTPLHLTMYSNRFAFLLSAGADVNAANALRKTPLHCAIYECKEVLRKQVARMMALDLFVSESNSLAIRSDDEAVSLLRSCEAEVELMKRIQKFDGIPLFDILTKNAGKLKVYARNKDVVQYFKSNVYLSVFPLYASQIMNRFAPEIELVELLDSGLMFFDVCLPGLPRLAFVCSQEILTHLSKSDLQILKDLQKPEKL